MSNNQLLTSQYSVVNNSNFVYKSTQSPFRETNVKLPFDNKNIELRNYKSKNLNHREFDSSRFNNKKIFPYKTEPISIKENEIIELNAWDKANHYSEITKRRQIRKKEILKEKELTIQDAIINRQEKIFIEEEKEKIQLEKDIISIISHALKFSKDNNPMQAMMSSEMNEQLLKLSKQRRSNKKVNSSLNKSLNKSLNSLMNLSSLSTKSVKYDSNRFLKALGLDVGNLNPDNITINIDSALDQISKWRLVDKSKIRNLIRMRVINEISSIEERKSVLKMQKLNQKYKSIKKKHEENKKSKEKELKLLNENARQKFNAFNRVKEDKTQMNVDNNISDISKIEKDNNPYININNNYTHIQVKDNSTFNNETNSLLKSTTMKTHDDSRTDKLSKMFSAKSKSKSKGKAKYIVFQKKTKTNRPAGKKVLNSYHQAEQLLKIVYSNPSLKENLSLKSHFENIYQYKETDDLISKVIYRNRITTNTSSANDLIVSACIPEIKKMKYKPKSGRLNSMGSH